MNVHLLLLLFLILLQFMPILLILRVSCVSELGLQGSRSQGSFVYALRNNDQTFSSLVLCILFVAFRLTTTTLSIYGMSFVSHEIHKLVEFITIV